MLGLISPAPQFRQAEDGSGHFVPLLPCMPFSREESDSSENMMQHLESLRVSSLPALPAFWENTSMDQGRPSWMVYLAFFLLTPIPNAFVAAITVNSLSRAG